jgi:hydroxymethylpyrimidine pyrophosphatase-like HAD family hydrolase
MYQELGYEQTNSFFCNLLGLDDFVILNSFDNVFISARTKSGNIISDEGEIVDYNNPDDIIMDIIYTANANQNTSGPYLYGLNQKAIDAVLNADLIIISTGTFWSSIYPTLDYMDFYKYINASAAKKIWAINNEEDGDSYGVTSNQFIEFLNNLRIDLSQFSILENSDARTSLVEPNDNYNVVVYPMGNVKGKHIGEKYVKAILKIFYDLKPISDYDKIIFDFDDTLWSRNENLLDISIDNIKRLNALKDKALIVSGNSYKSIRTKLSRIYGSGLDAFDIYIWADANSTLFKNNNPINYAKDLLIGKKYVKGVVDFLHSLGMSDFEINDSNYPAYIKIKPLSELERTLLVALIDTKFSEYAIKATKTGYTTVDITSQDNTKGKLFSDMIDPDSKLNTLYLGDEIDSGNDEDISKLCSQCIRVASVKDTNIILKLLED